MDSWREYDWCLFSIATTAVGFVFIQCGLTLLEAGTVRSKATKRIIIKNSVLLVISGAAFWLVGYTFAYSDGGDADRLIGLTFFTSSHLSPLSLIYIPYTAIASTIVSGAVAERCSGFAYLVYTVFISGFIQPVVAHWAWHTAGWLFVGERERYHKLNGIGFQDWAGGGVIYVAGGIAALTGAIALGPRNDRFHNSSNTVVPIKNQSVTVATVGGCFLLLGLLAINGGPRHLFTDIGDVLLKYVANKAISSAVAAFISLILYRLVEKSWSLLVFINGAISGMVAISAGCDVFEYYAACIVGLFAAVVYRIFSFTLVRVLIDDPLDAFAVYFGGGSWGLIALAFFDNSKGIVYALNIKSAHFLGWQCIGMASIAVWTALLSGLVFGLLRCFGILGISKEVEERVSHSTTFSDEAFDGEVKRNFSVSHSKIFSNEAFDGEVERNTREEHTEHTVRPDETVNGHRNSPWYMHWYDNPTYLVSDRDYVTRL